MSQLITLAHGDPRYARLLDRISADAWLVSTMEFEAESRPEELDVPGTLWSVALVGGAPAAWCAARLEGDEIKGFCNYEHPHYRNRGLYVAAYRERHRTVIEPANRPAVTYLFRQPIALHEEYGWRKTGLTEVSALGHRWWELRRPATVTD